MARRRIEADPAVDHSTIESTRAELAGIIARRFRAAAHQFRHPTGRLDRLHIGWERYYEYPRGLPERCGEWLIEAHRRGLVTAKQMELRKPVEYHITPNKPLPANDQAQKVRCGENLFHDVVGGGVLFGVIRGQDANGRLVLDEQRRAADCFPASTAATRIRRMENATPRRANTWQT